MTSRRHDPLDPRMIDSFIDGSKRTIRVPADPSWPVRWDLGFRVIDDGVYHVVDERDDQWKWLPSPLGVAGDRVWIIGPISVPVLAARIERFDVIDEAGAVLEGVRRIHHGWHAEGDRVCATARGAFVRLWDRRWGRRHMSRASIANPMVWVYDVGEVSP